MQRRVYVIGVGVSRFAVTCEGAASLDEVIEVARSALADAGIARADVNQVIASYSPGLPVGYWREALGLPATSSGCRQAGPRESVLMLARQAVANGSAECVLALGFDQTDNDPDQGQGAGPFRGLGGHQQSPGGNRVQAHGDAALEYLSRFDVRPETLAMAAVVAREHGSRHPLALFAAPLTLEQVMADEQVAGPLTRAQCCTRVYGAGAVLVCSETFIARSGARAPVQILAHAAVAHAQASDDAPLYSAAGYALNVAAARHVYEQSEIGPEAIDVCELHDSTTIAAVLLYEALGLCREGHADRFIEDGDNTYGGNVVINPSGGLLANGFSLRATELAQCAELVTQLRGEAGPRQVKGARIALQSHLGLAATREVTLYRCD
ncbi:thiolase C-terminal domain-containing protein [Pseudomonas sp. NPDC090755]|uniref:thiolase C-terminal domain-containing protein n=1 Tax=Pseudomonas sp. NPDC090755 TaxID=3364481 RepID=UPI00383AF16A